MESIPVAVVQAEPVFFNAYECLKKVAEWSEKAAAANARIVLFPESFIPAYPRGLSFGTVVGKRKPEGRAVWLEYWKNSVEVPGPICDELGAIARRLDLYLIIGVTEREPLGGSLYCTLLYFGPDGSLLQRHRKLKPTAAERIIWGEGKGNDLDVLLTPFGRMGGLICWENYMPLARMELYRQGVDIYFAPTADERSSWTASMRHIACEGRCYVLGCNQVVRKSSYPPHLQEEVADWSEFLSRGGSIIVNPLGEVITGPLWEEEGILTASMDPDLVIKGKMDFDPVGHYNRPDLFKD